MSEPADRPPDSPDAPPRLTEDQLRGLVRQRLRDLGENGSAVGRIFCGHHRWIAEEIAEREGLLLVLEGAYQHAQAETTIAYCRVPEETPSGVTPCGCLGDLRLIEKKRRGRARA